MTVFGGNFKKFTRFEALEQPPDKPRGEERERERNPLKLASKDARGGSRVVAEGEGVERANEGLGVVR